MNKQPDKINGRILTVLIIAFVQALISVFRNRAAVAWDSTALLFVLAGILAWKTLEHPRTHVKFEDNTLDFVLGVALLGSFVGICFLPSDAIGINWIFGVGTFLILLAPVCYYCGRIPALIAAGPLSVFQILIPCQEVLLLMLSHPLRLMATLLCAETLQLFGMQIDYSLTTIKLPEVDLAITQACSGIQQFEAMLLLGYLVVLYNKTGLFWGTLHYAFIIPAVILANAIRLIVVILLFKWLGNRVLYGYWHEGLGYMQVILTLIIFWYIGKLLIYLKKHHDEEKRAATSKEASK